ncbi:probable small nuclear ribonucleoprotein G [Oscarella lobularis]|uniref:probable small nuclear ribonucleoprotein G n=1 Tax=Oscarella lobularis TaxID=121494 RepID=UPI003313AD4C
MSGKAHPPELKKYMDHRIFLKLNGNRHVSGVLRGFDPFMNIVLDDAVEEVSDKEKNGIGSVVIRGNSIVMVNALERI